MMTCKTCGHPKDNHPYRHPFVGLGSDMPINLEPEKPKKEKTSQAAENRALFDMNKRLVEVLILRGDLTSEEATYVLLGFPPLR